MLRHIDPSDRMSYGPPMEYPSPVCTPKEELMAIGATNYHGKETPAKPYGDPEGGTICIPQKLMGAAQPEVLIGLPVYEAEKHLTALGRICYLIDPSKDNKFSLDKAAESSPVFVVEKEGVIVKASAIWRDIYPETNAIFVDPKQQINSDWSLRKQQPLQQPLFDSEWYVPTKGIKELLFFCNPANAPYHHLDEKKTKHDTNLNQRHMLDYPREHSILGFRASLDAKTSQEDREALLSNGALVEFRFNGNRPYLQVPFADICAARKDGKSTGDILSARELDQSSRPPEEKDPNNYRYGNKDFCPNKPSTASTPEDSNQKLVEMAIQLLDKTCGKNYYPFNLGRSALKIKPGEAFSMLLSWKKTPQVSRPVRIVMEIVGLLWQPL